MERENKYNERWRERKIKRIQECRITERKEREEEIKEKNKRK